VIACIVAGGKTGFTLQWHVCLPRQILRASRAWFTV